MSKPAQRILILGATGMLGSALVRAFAPNSRFKVVAAARSPDVHRRFARELGVHGIDGLDAASPDNLAQVIAAARPDVVINCVGLIKQLAHASEVMSAVPINTLLPHRLARLCLVAEARLIHISTDCVFSGIKGDYREEDRPDADDVYGRSKLLGEIREPPAITLRTSIIGHELATSNGLLEWFLSQSGSCKGFTRALFSGLPTVELARVIRDHVIPNPGLSGLYHVSAEAIAKYALLKLIAAEYGVDTEIVPDPALVIDRSLNSDRFRRDAGYSPPSWPELVAAMRRFA